MQSFVLTPVYILNINNMWKVIIPMMFLTFMDYLLNVVDMANIHWIFDTTLSKYSVVPVTFMVEVKYNLF